MPSDGRSSVRRRGRLAVVGALPLMALTVATAAASVPAQMGVAAHEPTQLGAGSRPRTPIPAFPLDRGQVVDRCTDAPASRTPAPPTAGTCWTAAA